LKRQFVIFAEMINAANPLQIKIKKLTGVRPLKNSLYYQFHLFANEQGDFYSEVFTHWVGFTERGPRHEIREASLFESKDVTIIRKHSEKPFFVINTEKDFHFFIFVIGGNSFIEKSLAEKYLKHRLQPEVNIYSYDNAFVSIHTVAKEKLQRAPAPKLRMKIFDRDNRRCKICGASPSNNEHVELHIHHIRPYAIGGITDENNLITLCHTCHKGLSPEVDYSLFQSIGVSMFSKRLNNKPFVEKLLQNIFWLNKFRQKMVYKK
jgi:hypothetical protein